MDQSSSLLSLILKQEKDSRKCWVKEGRVTFFQKCIYFVAVRPTDEPTE